MTQPTVSKHWRKILTNKASIPSGPPHHAHNDTTTMQYETKKTHKYTRLIEYRLIDWVRLYVPPTHYRSYGDGFLRVKWPNQQCQSTEDRSKGSGFNPIRSTPPCSDWYNNYAVWNIKKQIHAKIHTYKWIYAQWNVPSETKPSPENCKNCSSKCAYDCAQLQYTIQHTQFW